MGADITPDMAEVGGMAYLYWNVCSDEPDAALIARSIFGVMTLVASGKLTIAEVRDQIMTNTEHEFWRRFS